MDDRLTVVTINSLNEDKQEIISLSGTDTLNVMYELAAEAHMLRKGTFMLEHQSSKLESSRRLVSETELVDSCEVTITLSTAEKARMKLAQLGKEATVRAYWDAVGDRDEDLAQLCLDAGISESFSSWAQVLQYY
ncbi:hypothetical protein DIPPA_15991 [Diplonema papillatum]|nr:hypothetical protein DIPPA_21252 [Diplonema papillatum]KAJ9464379.1 hypothetical protein DIPPA_15991 [Diplonema papillatum]|eukprot:gene15981-24458_t